MTYKIIEKGGSMSNNVCPNCGVILDKEVKKKTLCPHCKKNIFVRSGKVISEKEVFIEDWKQYFDYMVPDVDELVTSTKARLKEKFGSDPQPRDVIWNILNDLVLNIKDPEKLSTLYLHMSKFQTDEGHLESAKESIRASHLMELKSFYDRSPDLTRAIKINAQKDNYACSECKSADGSVVAAIDALKKFPLPHKTCTNKQCRCTYEVLSEYDLDDRKEKMHGTSGKMDPNESGEFNCMVCGTNMGQPKEVKKMLGLKVERFLWCPKCKAKYNIRAS
jgi:uncharacterized Zn finger protein (UPF0148 family)